jgi:SAM-dependent methyltransferase
MNVKETIKKLKPLVWTWEMARSLYHQFGLNIPIASMQFARFMVEYRRYKRNVTNENFECSADYLFPCLLDKTAVTPLDPTYYFQDAWAAGKLSQIKPVAHYDVGSSAKSMAIISRFVPVTMIDIRPIDLKLDSLAFKQGTILDLPFESGSIASLSSLCVVEHIGLGRYGDPIDPWGTEKAVSELLRVLKMGGDLLVSLPIDRGCRVYFNAHRSFTRDYVFALFKGLRLMEEKYIYGRQLFDNYDPDKGFGTGLFHFRK